MLVAKALRIIEGGGDTSFRTAAIQHIQLTSNDGLSFFHTRLFFPTVVTKKISPFANLFLISVKLSDRSNRILPPSQEV